MCRIVCTKAPITGNVYNLVDQLISAIDKAVEALTGDRQLFHLRGHSTTSTPFNDSCLSEVALIE